MKFYSYIYVWGYLLDRKFDFVFLFWDCDGSGDVELGFVFKCNYGIMC